MVKKYIPTQEHLELIKNNFSENVSATKIAKKIGINQNLLHKICNEYNIINPKSPSIITESVILLITNLFNGDVSLRKIAEETNYDVKFIKKVCDKIGLDFSTRGLKGGQKALPISKEKLCPQNNGKGCGVVKLISEFRMISRIRKSGNLYTKPSSYCLLCENKNSLINSKLHYINNKEYYVVKGKKANKRMSEREKLEPALKLRNRISVAINQHLKNRNSSKNGKSIMNYLPYTIEELKQHLESQFEPWMNWTNHGVYRLGGERKWHIDHIMPQSKLPFTSMEDENFKKCWSLSNLQPLEATKNMSKHDKILL